MNEEIKERDHQQPRISPRLDRTFKIGLLLKAADGVLEIIGGILLLVVSPSSINTLAQSLTTHELSQDPNDPVAHFILNTTNTLSTGTTLFAVIYLLSHGISKLVLAVMVLKHKLGAYPWLIALIVIFIAYQIYVIILVKFSWGLSALTVFDVFLVWLTWREYQVRKYELQAKYFSS